MGDFSLAQAGSIEALLRTIIERTGYTRAWEESPSEQDQQRLANVQELLTAARQYDRAFADDPTLEGFLEQTSLVSELDNLDDNAGQVTLMTLHAAKGLEFPVVYVIAVEQNLIPHERSLRSGDLHEVEEERRLLFVGMTRAMQQLYLTQTRSREFRGRPLSTIPSDFLTETEFVVNDFLGDAARNRNGRPSPNERRRLGGRTPTSVVAKCDGQGPADDRSRSAQRDRSIGRRSPGIRRRNDRPAPALRAGNRRERQRVLETANGDRRFRRKPERNVRRRQMPATTGRTPLKRGHSSESPHRTDHDDTGPPVGAGRPSRRYSV